MANRKKKSNAGVLARALLALIVVGVVVGGVTFAVLQSQAAVVRGNSIQTATANLQVSRTDSNFTDIADGYQFMAMIPGGQATPSFPVYVKNTGSTKLALRVSVPGPLANTGNINLSKVHVILTFPESGNFEQTITLAELVAANASGGVPLDRYTALPAMSRAPMTIKVAMDADAYTGSGATIENFSFNFSGVAVN